MEAKKRHSNKCDWGRYQKVWDARREGATFKQAGALVGVSGQRARQMVWKMEVALGLRIPESDAWFDGAASAEKTREKYKQWRNRTTP